MGTGGVLGTPAAGEAGGTLPGGLREAWPHDTWISGFWSLGLCEKEFVSSEATQFVAVVTTAQQGSVPSPRPLGRR